MAAGRLRPRNIPLHGASRIRTSCQPPQSRHDWASSEVVLSALRDPQIIPLRHVPPSANAPQLE